MVRWPFDPLGVAPRRGRARRPRRSRRRDPALAGRVRARARRAARRARAPARRRRRASALPTRVPASRFKDFVDDPDAVAVAAAPADARAAVPGDPARHALPRLGRGPRRLDAPAADELDTARRRVATARSSVSTPSGSPALKATFEASPWAGRRPVEVEREIHLPFDGRIVICKIDAIYAGRRGRRRTFEVVDWKTGKAPKDAADLQQQAAAARAVPPRLREVGGHRRSSASRAAFYFVADDLHHPARAHRRRGRAARALACGLRHDDTAARPLTAEQRILDAIDETALVARPGRPDPGAEHHRHRRRVRPAAPARRRSCASSASTSTPGSSTSTSSTPHPGFPGIEAERHEGYGVVGTIGGDGAGGCRTRAGAAGSRRRGPDRRPRQVGRPRSVERRDPRRHRARARRLRHEGRGRGEPGGRAGPRGIRCRARAAVRGALGRQRGGRRPRRVRDHAARAPRRRGRAHRADQRAARRRQRRRADVRAARSPAAPPTAARGSRGTARSRRSCRCTPRCSTWSASATPTPTRCSRRPTLPYPISVGTVRAGDWASSVPDLLVAEGRLGVRLDEAPGRRPRRARGRRSRAAAAATRGCATTRSR